MSIVFAGTIELASFPFFKPYDRVPRLPGSGFPGGARWMLLGEQ